MPAGAGRGAGRTRAAQAGSRPLEGWRSDARAARGWWPITVAGAWQPRRAGSSPSARAKISASYRTRWPCRAQPGHDPVQAIRADSDRLNRSAQRPPDKFAEFTIWLRHQSARGVLHRPVSKASVAGSTHHLGLRAGEAVHKNRVTGTAHGNQPAPRGAHEISSVSL